MVFRAVASTGAAASKGPFVFTTPAEAAGAPAAAEGGSWSVSLWGSGENGSADASVFVETNLLRGIVADLDPYDSTGFEGQGWGGWYPRPERVTDGKTEYTLAYAGAKMTWELGGTFDVDELRLYNGDSSWKAPFSVARIEYRNAEGTWIELPSSALYAGRPASWWAGVYRSPDGKPFMVGATAIRYTQGDTKANRARGVSKPIQELEAFGAPSALAPAPALATDGTAWTGSALVASLSRENAGRAANVYAVAGAAHHELDVEAWEEDLGEPVPAGAFAAGDASSVAVFASVPAGANYVRFFARPVVDGEETGETFWSRTVFLPVEPVAEAAEPVFSALSFEGFRGNAARFRVRLPWIGSGASSATVKARWGTDSNALDRVSALGAFSAAPGDTGVSLAGLSPGGTYYATLFAENDRGETSAESAVFEIATGLGATSADATETIGLGAETVYVWKGGADGTNGTLTVAKAGWAEVLLVGGGGSGGSSYGWNSEKNGFAGGGGGAGGLVHRAALWLEAGSYEIVVGAGGAAPALYAPGNDGGDTFLRRASDGWELRAIGGGGGGSSPNGTDVTTADFAMAYGRSGGSGGGSTYGYGSLGWGDSPPFYLVGSAGTPGQGHGGGASGGYYFTAGGGGGAGAPGGSVGGPDPSRSSGAGGDGLPCDVTGEEAWYAGGGGGGSSRYDGSTMTPGTGGRGGGGSGAFQTGLLGTEEGVDGLGGGGGGAHGKSPATTGYRGGSGFAAVRFVSLESPAPAVADVEVAGQWRAARVTGRVAEAGDGGSTVSVYLSVSPDATGGEVLVASGVKPGADFSGVVSGLAASTEYTWTMRVENDLGDEGVAVPAAGSFATTASAYLEISGFEGAVQSVPAQGEKLLAFTNLAEAATTFTVSEPGYARVLLVGGGGAGGYGGAGGGGGGVIDDDAVWFRAGTYAVTIGAGGEPSTGDNQRHPGGATVILFTDPATGETTEFLRAHGGGGAGSYGDNNGLPGQDGGSGGGGATRSGNYNCSGGQPLDPRQGFPGGNGLNAGDDSARGSGGGGGAGGPGGSARVVDGVGFGGSGGPGRASDITGELRQYGGGGGAGFRNGGAGAGGDGVSGFGVSSASALAGNEDGRDGVGSGGGGGWWTNQAGQNANGRRGGDGGFYLRWVDGARATPDVEIASAGPAPDDPAAAEVVVNVRNLAFGGEVALSLEYGVSADSLPLSLAVDGSFGEGAVVAARLPGLKTGTTWFVRARAENRSGEGFSSTVAVEIPAASGASDGSLSTAGLWQSVCGTGPDQTDAYWDRGLSETRVSGVLVANGVKNLAEYADPLDGRVFRWLSRTTGGQQWAYRGYIHLEAGVPYVFAARWDDSVYLAIDGNELIRTYSDWTHSCFAPLTVAETGWYPIDVRLGDVEGGHGPDGDGVQSWTSFGLAFNGNGSEAMIPESGWTQLLDPGDGSLLRTEKPAAREVWIDSYAVADGTLSIAAKAGSGDVPAHAWLVHGPADAGTASLGLWATAVDLGPVAAADAAADLAAQVAGWGTGSFVARLALETDGAWCWSDSVTALADAFLDVTGVAVTDNTQGDRVTFGGVVEGGAAPYAATVLLGASVAEMAAWTNAALSAAGRFAVTAEGLDPGGNDGATYYWQLVVRDAAGAEIRTETGSFTTPAKALAVTTYHEVARNQRSLTFQGRMSRLGAGTTWGVLFIGDYVEGTRDTAIREIHTVEVEETGLFELTIDGFDWDRDIWFSWCASNSNGRQDWYQGRGDQNNVKRVSVIDDQTYWWKGGTGYWNDPEMWTTDGSKAHDQAGFPRRGSTVKLAEGATEGTIVVPPEDRDDTETGYWYVSRIEVADGQTLTLKREGSNRLSMAYDDSSVGRSESYPAVSVAAGGKIVFDGGTWYQWNKGGFNFARGSATKRGGSLAVVNGADVSIGYDSAGRMGVYNYENSGWNDLYVGPGSRLYSRSHLYNGGVGTTNVIEGTLETAASDAATSRELGFYSLSYKLGETSPLGYFALGGENPRLVAGGNLFASSGGSEYAGRGDATLNLLVPAGGFAEAPIRHQKASTAGAFPTAGNEKLVLFVPPDAPAAVAKGVTDADIVRWPTNGTSSVVNPDRLVIRNEDLPHSDTDYWYETADPATGLFTGWGVHIVGRPASEAPQVVGIAMTNLLATTADFTFYGIPGDNAASATFSAAIARTDDPSDASATVALAGGPSVAQGTLFGLSVSGLVEGGTYRITVEGVDPADARLSCVETFDFDALRDYGEASTDSAGATTAQLGPETVWTFADTENEGRLVVTRPGWARILVVGGGGSGGGALRDGWSGRHGGGGGGGGQVVETNLFLMAGAYDVVVGAGGAGVADGTTGKDGSSSRFSSLVGAAGGGGGGRYSVSGRDGGNGGGAGGGSGLSGGAATVAGGHAGGTGALAWNASYSIRPAGGGGGAGADGGDGLLDDIGYFRGGSGGDGLPSDITGTTVFYGGGGGGGAGGMHFLGGGVGGAGGGGAGRSPWFSWPDAAEQAAGADGLGGGGGGGASGTSAATYGAECQSERGAPGGTGVVIVRMRTRTAATNEPQVSVSSATPSAGGLGLAAIVHSLGAGAASADLLLAFDKAADYAAAAGFSRTNFVATVGATGPADFAANGLRPGTDYVAALVATNAAGGVCTVDLGAFRTADEYHGDADSGIDAAPAWTLESWTDGADSFSDNLLRATRGTKVCWGSKYTGNSSSPVNEFSGASDMTDGTVHTTSYNWGQGFQPGDQRAVVFGLSEPVALRSLKLFARYNGNARYVGIEGVDVRSSWNEPWTELPGSGYVAPNQYTGQAATFSAAGDDWLAREVAQIRIRCCANVANDHTVFHEMEAYGAPESEAPGLHGSAGRGRPLAAGAAVRTAAGVSGLVSAEAGEPAFDDVVMAWGAAYGGEDTNAWKHARGLGPLGTGAGAFAWAIGDEDLDGAVYVRFAGFGADGTVSWSDSVYVPDLELVDGQPPVVEFGVCAGSAGASADLTAALLYAGSASQDGTASISLQLTLDPDGFAEGSQATILDFPFAERAAVGAVGPVRVQPLRAARRYYGRFLGTDGARVSTNEVFTFDTAAGGGAAAAGVPGLRQVWVRSGVGGGNNFDVFDPDDSRWATEVVPGAVMARYSSSGNGGIGDGAGNKIVYTAPSGTTYSWERQRNSTFYYDGYMFVEAGHVYNFFECEYDLARIDVDGTTIIRNTNYGQSSTGSYAAAATGWVPIKVWLGGVSGNTGAANGWNYGVGWNDNGTTTASSACTGWNTIENVDGEPPRFCVAPARTPEIVGVDFDATGATLDVAVPGGAASATVRAAWNATDLGDSAAIGDWAGSGPLGAVGAAAATVSGTVSFDTAATPVVRAVVSESSGDYWSAPVLLGGADPMIGSASGEADGDTLAVAGAMFSTGSGNGLSLTLLAGYGDDAVATATNDLTIAQDGTFSIDAVVLPGTNGWWRLVARTSDGGYDATLPAPFETAAGSELLPSATSTVSHHTATVTATLAVLGAGTTTASIWAGDSPTNLAEIADSRVTVSRTGSFDLTATIPGDPHEVYWKVVSVNTTKPVGEAEWTSETDVFRLETLDQGVYTWKPAVEDGIWNDSGNWTVEGVDEDDCIGYPDSPTAVAKFLAGTRATVRVSDEFEFKELFLRERGLDVSFVGTNAATCKLSGGNLTLDGDVSGGRIVFSGVTVYDGTGTADVGNDVTEDFVLRAENGAVASLGQYTHLRGTNTWVEAASGAVLRWRKQDDANSENAGLDLCNFDGGLRLDGGEADVPWLVPQRFVKKEGPAQRVEIGGAGRLPIRNWYRIYSTSDDLMCNDVRFEFLVPDRGWGGPDAAPVHAGFVGGTDNKKFAWNASETTGKSVFSVSGRSPAFSKGKTFRTHLCSWLAGIDEKSVRLEDSATSSGIVWARVFYTYGWPSTRTEPYYEGEVPTGIAADIKGQGGTFLIFR